MDCDNINFEEFFILIIFVFVLFLEHIFYSQTYIQLFQPLAIIISPIIALGFGYGLIKEEFERKKRLEIMNDLFIYRNSFSTSDTNEKKEFFKALNSIKLFYYKDRTLLNLLNLLHNFWSCQEDQKEDFIKNIDKEMTEELELVKKQTKKQSEINEDNGITKEKFASYLILDIIFKVLEKENFAMNYSDLDKFFKFE